MVHIQLKTLKPLELKVLNSKKSKSPQSFTNSSSYDILISVSLFMMKESYRKFPEYVNSFLNWFPQIPRNTCVRMYVDDSVIDNEDFKKIMDLKAPHLEIIQFYCQEFFDGDLTPSNLEDQRNSKTSRTPNSPRTSKSSPRSTIIFKKPETSFPKGYHDGTFGSIVRLLPLFEKPQGIKYIWISDTDMPAKFFNYKNIKEMQTNNAKVFYYSKACYDKPWSEGIRYPIGAGRIIMNTRVELNKGLLTRFLNDILKGKYHDVLVDIKRKFEDEGSYRSFQNIRLFPYGFDELFTNKYLYPIFTHYKRIIAFEIGLSTFLQEKIVEIPGKKKQYTNLYFKSWAWKMKGDEYKFLLDTTQEIYEKIKDIDFKTLDNKKAQVLETCKRDYEDHRKYINPVSLEGGISAFLVKKPNQE